MTDAHRNAVPPRAWRTGRRTRRVCSALGAVALLATTACRWVTTGSPAALSPVPASAPPRRVLLCAPAACTDSLDVVAMGVSGFLFIPWRDTTGLVLSPPAFRHPSVWRLVFTDWLLGTRPDSARIARRLAAMPQAGPSRLARVRGVLVGHGHYDHLLDLPPLMRYMPYATVFGSETVVHLLHGDPELRDSVNGQPRLVNIEAGAGHSAQAPGRWQTVSGTPFRFHAADWEHAHNVARFTFSPGAVRAPRQSLPRTAAGWREGRTFAYALDLAGPDGRVALRVVLHDAAATPPAVQRAAAAWGPTAAPTVVIMSAANYDQVPDYPGSLVAALQPAHVLLGHWEDFFRSPEQPPRVVRGIEAPELVRRLTRAVQPWSALEPGATLRLLFPADGHLPTQTAGAAPPTQ